MSKVPSGRKHLIRRFRGRRFESQLGHIIFMEIHEIISTVILSLLLIEEGQLSVTGKSICISTG